MLSKLFSRHGRRLEQPESIGKYEAGGKGLCVIMANFVHTSDALDGYDQDVKNIRNTFGDSTKFDFEVIDRIKHGDNSVSFIDTNKKEFILALELLQAKIKTGHYDKLVVFVLSHGSEQGILMCGDEQEYVAVDDIIESFSHEKVPNLKGIPKCFFFQACRGHGETRAAAKKDTQVPLKRTSPLTMPEISRANFLIGYATLKKKRSYVKSTTGSFYINNLCETLKSSDRNTDLMSIMTEVNEKSSKAEAKLHFAFNEDSYSFEANFDDAGTLPVTLVALRKGGQKETIPVEYTADGYQLSHQLKDYTFKGKVVFRETKHTIWDSTEEVKTAEWLKQFSNNYDIEGCLYSKTDSRDMLNGRIEIKEEEFRVDGHKNYEQLSNYNFKGKVTYKNTQRTIWDSTEEIKPAEWLQQFCDNHDIEGCLMSKLDGTLRCFDGTIKVTGKTFESKGLFQRQMKDFDLMIMRGNKPHDLIHPDELQGKEGKFYVNGQLHGDGTFNYITVDCDRHMKTKVWGINCNIYQMSVFCSTLTKQLNLYKPQKRPASSKSSTTSDLTLKALTERVEKLEAERRVEKAYTRSHWPLNYPDMTASTSTHETGEPPFSVDEVSPFQPAGRRNQRKKKTKK